MPPFRTGLKRKPDAEVTESSNLSTTISNEKEDDDLLHLMLGEDIDETDSEGEDGATQSDEEQESVMFRDDDSTLGDEDSDEDQEQNDNDSDESSDLPDSEEDNDEGSKNVDSETSDIESGIGQTYSDSSDADDKTKNKKFTKTLNKDAKKLESDEGSTEKVKLNQKSPQKVKKVKKKTASDVIDQLNKEIESSHINTERDEYASGDSSDEEDRRNTVGNIPMWWYNDYPHIGYNLDGKKLLKPPQRDQIEEFLKKCEDPDFWRTVKDPQTGQDIILSQEDLELLQRIKEGRAPNAEHDEYAPWVDWFTSVVLKTPLRAFPEHKRSFLPSKSEEKKISKIVHALKMGWMKTRKQLAAEKKAKEQRQFYMLWGADNDEEAKLRGIHKHIPAPKRPLPSHAESYNPPAEYLLDSQEMREWNKLETTPWKRKYTYLPTKHNSLREVPAYERYIRERFLRCLDLYLAPRAIKMRLTISPDDLVPKLPSPRELQPFPTTQSLVFKGHEDLVRSVDTDPTGQYVVSASDDQTVKVWETSTGRCLRTIKLGDKVRCAAWIPVAGLSLVACCVGDRVLLINPGAGIGDHRISERTDELLEEAPPKHNLVDERTTSAVQWETVAPESWARGIRISIKHFKEVKHISWHAKGDYLVATVKEGASRAVIVHQISRRGSQLPFTRSKGLVQQALFHPHRPTLFIATQRVVRVYDLVKQELVKKLLTGSQWISHMAIHPAGDNLLVAGYDKKVMWFDLDLSSQPYQTLRLHSAAVRSVAYSPRYPLFASAGDDLKIIVSHGMVYNDLLQNPLIVPLKQLKGHESAEDFGILGLKWHPTQPWLFSAGADSTIRLFT